MSGEPKLWKTKDSKLALDCRVFRVREDQMVSPHNSKEYKFFCIECPAWVNVIAITENKEVVLIEQFRHGISEITLEIPGGMVDEDEPPQDTAARELVEETGYRGSPPVLLGRSRPNPALQNNWLYSYLITDARLEEEPNPNETENILVKKVPIDEIDSLIVNGRITHSLVLAAFHFLSLRNRG
jgi:ADP-ribose pyrophosphatase